MVGMGIQAFVASNPPPASAVGEKWVFLSSKDGDLRCVPCCLHRVPCCLHPYVRVNERAGKCASGRERVVCLCMNCGVLTRGVRPPVKPVSPVPSTPAPPRGCGGVARAAVAAAPPPPTIILPFALRR